MPTPSVEVRDLTKRYDGRAVVDRLTFDLHPGRITGFLGPNGAGKSTTMRCMVGLDRLDGGSIRIGGRRYHELARPLAVVGAVLDDGDFHPGRSARDHLTWVAQSQGFGIQRADDLLRLVGLDSVGGQRVGGFSLGMRQRLGLATALVGDPGVLLLDEPLNGLDPEGVHWVRTLLRRCAAEGRTVLVSSHLLHEMAVVADHLVVIAQGRLLADQPTADFVGRHGSLEAAFMALTAGHLDHAARTHPAPTDAVLSPAADRSLR
jgi:ABC-2 type transport system ATP-binding protein